MTREEVLERYKVNEDGVIESPGKFEGEMLYMPHFWEAYLKGEARDLMDGSISILIEPKEREMFPELGKRKRVVKFNVDENGFVWESR